MAKNCLHNVNGFSPHQLVYGKNPNLPSVSIHTPPALEGTSISKYVTNHMKLILQEKHLLKQSHQKGFEEH